MKRRATDDPNQLELFSNDFVVPDDDARLALGPAARSSFGSRPAAV